MNAKLISKEKNTVKLTFEVGAEKLEEGMKYSYNKNKNRINIPGFRKGKAPRKLIEAQYGAAIFYDDAVNFVLGDAYEDAISTLDLEVVSKPEIDVDEIDKEKGVSFSATVSVKPEVLLGDYKGLEYERVDTDVTDDEVEAELNSVQDKNARTVDVERAAEMGDIATIAYNGTVDGVAFEGGSAESYELTLGSHSFIDTFEEQIVGHNVGDKFDVNVTFPEEYHEKSLAGKAAVFAVELKGISVRELPEIDDEFAQDVSEFDTLDEYKSSIMAKLKETKEINAKNKSIEELVDKAAENATIDVPEAMIDTRVNQMLEEIGQNFARQGIPMDTYFKYLGTTADQMKAMYRPRAEKMVRGRLTLEKIAEVEGFNASEDEVNDSIKKIAESYGIEFEKMNELASEAERKSIKTDILIQKAIDFIYENGVEVEPKNEEGDSKAEE